MKFFTLSKLFESDSSSLTNIPHTLEAVELSIFMHVALTLWNFFPYWIRIWTCLSFESFCLCKNKLRWGLIGWVWQTSSQSFPLCSLPRGNQPFWQISKAKISHIPLFLTFPRKFIASVQNHNLIITCNNDNVIFQLDPQFVNFLLLFILLVTSNDKTISI